MKIKFINIGKNDAAYLKQGMQVYLDKLKHYVQVEYIELPHVKLDGVQNSEKIKDLESTLLEKYLEKADVNVLLDENGKQYSSTEFSALLETYQMRSVKVIHFYTGGAYGFSEKVLKLADARISLSKLTFTHLMVRLIFLEQLYRAFTIIKKEKYHHL